MATITRRVFVEHLGLSALVNPAQHGQGGPRYSWTAPQYIQYDAAAAPFSTIQQAASAQSGSISSRSVFSPFRLRLFLRFVGARRRMSFQNATTEIEFE